MSLTRRLWIGASLAASALRPARAAPGVLRIGISTSLNGLDPMTTTLGDEYTVDNLGFNGLTRMREDLSIEPDLAESWSSTEDLKRWTFHLRRGVKFHNGDEMVPDEVVAIFKRLLDPKTAVPARSQNDMIATVSAPVPATVVFDLKVPCSELADIMSDRQVKITPRKYLAQMATKPIGTGPFKFVSYTPGDRVVLTRNPAYFEPGLPKLDGVELPIIPEMSVRIAALQAGDIDVLWDLPLDQVKDVGSRSGLRAESVPTASWDGAVLNHAIPPFNDVKVREAFNRGVDKKDLIELVLFGQGLPTISPIPPTHPFHAKDVVIPPHASRGRPSRLAPPGLLHPFGTDEFGRDVFSRVLAGAHLSLGFGAMFSSLLFGVPLGLLAAFHRGATEEIIVRTVALLISLPPILLGLLILAVTPPNPTKTIVAVGLVYIPILVRLSRAVALRLLEEDFVQAAFARGEGAIAVLWHEILPNAWPPIIVECGLRVTFGILLGSALSFLGLGPQPPSSEWGLTIAESRAFLTETPWAGLAPGLCLCLLLVSVNLVGEGLRESLDPQLTGRAHG